MSVILKLDNKRVTIKGAKRSIIRELERVTSYRVAGFQYSKAFKQRRWDGREHLLKFSSKHGYRAPIGLLHDIIASLEDQGMDYHLDMTNRGIRGPRIEYGWNKDIQLRRYQKEAIRSIVAPNHWNNGLGILKMPIRSGKTKTAAAVIRLLGVRTLFIVPSQMLLHQTKDSLEESLEMQCGIIGDGLWDEQVITVATVQTLAKARGGIKEDKDGNKFKIPADPRYKELVKRYDCTVFDECHHLRGDVWHEVMMDIDSVYRIGLSATAYLDNDREQERGVIWLKAICGEITIDVDTSRLIEEGFLMRQNVELHIIDEPDLHDRGWSETLRNEGINENVIRNQMIVDITAEKVNSGLKVLIVSNRLNQISIIADLMDKAGTKFTTVTGNDASSARRSKVSMFTSGEVDVLLGTVFGEGVDIPEIECVINAEGGRDVKAAVQRMRNLTPFKGKDTAVFVDFMDMTNAYFAQHSAERLATYRSESAFLISLIR